MSTSYEHIPSRDELRNGGSATHLTSMELMVLCQIDYERTLAPYQANPENPMGACDVFEDLADRGLISCVRISPTCGTEDMYCMTAKGKTHITILCGVSTEQ